MITQKLMSPVDINNSFTFSRPSTAFTSDGRLVEAQNARYEAGPTGFGNAIRIEEATTNQIVTAVSQATTQLLNSDTTGYLGGVNFNSNFIFFPGSVSSQTWSNNGSAATSKNAYLNGASNYSTVTAMTWSLTIYAKRSDLGDPGNVSAYMHMKDSVTLATDNATVPFTKQYVGNGWYKLTATKTTTNPNVSTVYLTGLSGLDVTNEPTYYFDGFHLEAKSYATSYTPSNRSQDVLTIDSSCFNKDEGTIEVRINPATIQNWNNFFSATISTGRFLLYFSSNGAINWDYGTINSGFASAAGAVVANQWITIAMKWSASGNSRSLFVNGTSAGSQAFTSPTSFPSVNLLNNYGALVADLRISNIARTDAELTTNGTATSPLPVDANTTLKLNFNGPDAVRGAKSLNLGAI